MVAKLLEGGTAKCFAFGPPPVYEPANQVSPKVASCIYSFVNNMDCIPRTCLGTVGKLLMAVREVDELSLDMAARMDVIRGSEPTEHAIPDHGEIPEELQSEFKCLYGMGTMVLIFKDAAGRMHAERCPSAPFFDKILMHPEMAQNHFITSYEESISETLMQQQKTKGCC
jgi:hypothetical protein